MARDRETGFRNDTPFAGRAVVLRVVWTEMKLRSVW